MGKPHLQYRGTDEQYETGTSGSCLLNVLCFALTSGSVIWKLYMSVVLYCQRWG
jgi:hypothetical protein